MDVSINLRDEMREFLEDHGYYILLHRTGRSLRCRCWSEKYREANPECPICLGTSWVGRIERHKIYHKPANQVVSRPDMTQATGIGDMWVTSENYYLEYDVNPKVGDYFYKVGWNGTKPTHIIQSFKISDVVESRATKGRVEMWSLSVKSDPIERKIRGITIRSIGSMKNYELVGGRP